MQYSLVIARLDRALHYSRDSGELSRLAAAYWIPACAGMTILSRDEVALFPDRSQIEKLVPQPHDAVAFGLTTRNEAPIRSSTKSTSEPARNGTEAGSTSTTAPSRAITRSSSARARSTSNLYWKPEQPPPSTEMRSMAPSPSVLRISPMRRAARSLTVMAVVMTCSPGRHTQFIWYEASDIVKCVIPWNQMDKD